MNAEQQTVWLHAAVEALEDIRADEVRHVSAEVRRSVTRPAQIVPEISKLVAARRAIRAEASRPRPQPLPEIVRTPGPPLTAAEIAKMPKWLRDMGLRAGLLMRDGDRIVDAGRA